MGASRHRRHGVRGTGNGARGARGHGRGRAGDGGVSRIALAILIALALACEGRRGEENEPAPPLSPDEAGAASIDSPSLAFLPRRADVPGWRLDGDPAVIPADRLRSYLQRDATRFAGLGVVDLTVGKYSRTDGHGFAIVEIFRFPDSVRSFGAYSMRKEGAFRMLAIPDESFRQAHSIHVWRGPFYMRVTGEGPDDALLELIAAAVARAPQAAGMPPPFAFLPDKDRVPGSERYSAESGFGQPYLANSFQATFNVGGDRIEGLVVPAHDALAAERILGDYRALYVRNGRLLDSVPRLGDDNFTAEDAYLGRAVAFSRGPFVVAFNGYGDRQHLVDLALAADRKFAQAASSSELAKVSHLR